MSSKYREVPQESTGFSTLELLYGWKVRGPLDVMKEMWSGSVSGLKSVVYHVINIREWLASDRPSQRKHERSSTKVKEMVRYQIKDERIQSWTRSAIIVTIKFQCTRRGKAHSKLTEKLARWTMKSRQTTKDGS